MRTLGSIAASSARSFGLSSHEQQPPRRIEVDASSGVNGGAYVVLPSGLAASTSGARSMRRAAATVVDSSPPVLEIRVEPGEGYVCAYDAVTGIFGAGPDLAQAFTDLASALIEQRDVLERQTRLSPGLERQLEYLRQRMPR